LEQKPEVKQSEVEQSEVKQSEVKPDSAKPNSAKASSGATGSGATHRVTVFVPPPKRPQTASFAESPHSFSPMKWLLRSVVFGGTAAIAAAIGLLASLTTPLPAAIAPQHDQPLAFNELWKQGLLSYKIDRPVNVLVMGIDLPLDLPEDAPANQQSVFAGRSDTMLLVRVDPTQNTANILSIPRDTQVDLPEEGTEKINYANVVGGSKLAAQVVSQNLNGVPIDRYVRVSTGAFRELVDLLGGVQVNVPIDMKYDDETQHLHINLKKGLQTLNGSQAEQFARFRNDGNGDIGRVQRQQQMIHALREKLTNPMMVARLPQAIELFKKYIDTNLSPEEMLSLVGFGLTLQKDNFHMVMLPGRFSNPGEYVASYWLMDQTGKDQVMQEFFDISSVAVLSQNSNVNNARIAVQNASHDPDLGSRAAAYLQSQGFSNVYVVDDWSEQEGKTQIIVQRGDLQGASTLEQLLGFGQVVSASTGDLESDFTLRVGDDWQERSKV
jgi:polyisoprenyl-teichoic acid--peptidoglycan teichoic acid transferase